MQKGRPQLFETTTAWEVYQGLPPEQRTYANVARKLTEQLNLDPPLAAQTISNRFTKAGLIEKKPRGAPKLKEKPLNGNERSRLKRYRDKVFDAIVQDDIYIPSEPAKNEVPGVGRPRLLDVDVAVRAYEEFGSIEKTADAIGFSYGAVRARLQEAGVVKKKGRPLIGDRALTQVERNKRRKKRMAQKQL